MTTHDTRTGSETAIPADVMEAAQKVVDRIDADFSLDRWRRPEEPEREAVLLIARTIMAERERCLGIVKLWGDTAKDLGQRVEASIASDIERHIRTGSPKMEKPHD